jgi:hypothetical protein
VLLNRHDSKLNAQRLLYLLFERIVEAVHRRVSAEVEDSADVKAAEEARAAVVGVIKDLRKRDDGSRGAVVCTS